MITATDLKISSYWTFTLQTFTRCRVVGLREPRKSDGSSDWPRVGRKITSMDVGAVSTWRDPRKCLSTWHIRRICLEWKIAWCASKNGSLAVFCETQWRHSVKTRLYNTPSPILHSVKRSDVTRWKQGHIIPLPPYFIALASSVKTKEVKVIKFHRISHRRQSWNLNDNRPC